MAFLETMAKLIERYNSFFTEGIVNTLIIAAFSVLFGAILGTLMASLRMCRIPPLRWIAVAYIEFVRGTPLMVQLMFIFYGLPMIGITIPNIPWIPNFSRFAAGIVAMSMNSCAYVAEIIRGGLKDPRISPWTSVVAVEVAPDLKSCKAWISVLGDEEVRKSTLQGLKSAEGFIRRELARTINLRNTPDITFVMDQSIEYGVNMSHKIDEVIAADEQAQKPENEVVEDTEETEEGDE